MTLLSAIPALWRKRLAIGGGVVAAAALAFVAGRYSAPTKTVEKTEWREIRSVETQWVTRTEYQDRTKIRTRIVTVEKVTPEGARETTRTEESGTDVAVNSSSNLSGQSSETTTGTVATARVSETSRAGWSVGVAGEWDPARLSSKPERVEVDVARRLVGTVWIVASGSVNNSGGDPRVGVGARVEF